MTTIRTETIRTDPRLAISRRTPSMLERVGRRIVHRVLDRLEHGRVTLIDAGVRRSSGDASSGPDVEVRVLDDAFYASVAFGGSLGAAEAYMDGLWDCDDLPGLIELLTTNMEALGAMEGPLRRIVEPISKLAYRLQANSRSGSRRNIGAHYDLSNEFFALWLDPTMTYSSAIFTEPEMSLEAAQIEKIDRACRKLELQPDDHLLEIGTGWGSVALHAAREYGCRVTTTTISRRQREEAAIRVKAAGLEDRITLLDRDYRDLDGAFDKVVSIEMIEAVGREYLDGYFKSIDALMKPRGLALIQAITIRDQAWSDAARRRDFLKKHIFPGSCLLSIESMSRAIRRSSRLRVLDVEDIGGHYVTTLQRWRDAFEERIDDVRTLGFDDRFCRMWRYYFAYCEGAFRAGHCSDVQMLLCGSRWTPARRG